MVPTPLRPLPAPAKLKCLAAPGPPESPVTDTGRVALIAHDAMKPAMLEFARRHRDCLATHPLVATGTTGRLLARSRARRRGAVQRPARRRPPDRVANRGRLGGRGDLLP
jgi:hypothetical protein